MKLMKLSFHQNSDVWASPNTVSVFDGGEPLTPEQLDRLLLALNTPAVASTLGDAVRAVAPEAP